MATMRGNPRLPVGSASWVAEERASALQVAEAETEEFTFSARNEVDWLNEHMAEVFSKNQVNVAEIFKTPGKLRGKTPRTARKLNPLEIRAPLSDVFSATPRGAASPFKHAHFERPAPTFRVAEDKSTEEEAAVEEPAKEAAPVPVLPNAGTTFSPKISYNPFDSGYYGSQDISTQPTQPNEPVHQPTPRASPIKESPMRESPPRSPTHDDSDENVEILGRNSEERRTTEGSFESAKEVLSCNNIIGQTPSEQVPENSTHELEQPLYPVLQSPVQSTNPALDSPQKRSPQRFSPVKEVVSKSIPKTPSKSPVKLPEPVIGPEHEPVDEDEQMDDADADVDAQSPSDGSSPLRPIVRKGSLNFASLPAREPITTKKSLGNRVSRTSQLEQSRTSYYGRSTGGKSLGNIRPEKEDDDEMDVDTPESAQEDDDMKMARLHNKTSTQRLQDQISMLGQSQTNVRASKSTAGRETQAQLSQPAQQSQSSQNQEVLTHKSPQPRERPPPGAFPEDEDDSWIGPPTATLSQPSVFSPRPPIVRSHTTDIMDGIHGKETISGPQFNIPKRGEEQRYVSPIRETMVPERTTIAIGHIKSVSASVLRSPRKAGDSPGYKKTISVSNPNPSINSKECDDTTPPKSPTRSYRGSPVKAAKDKFSSILKASRGLFASSALVSADAKVSSTLSPPSTSRLGFHHAPSFEDVLSQIKENGPVYPNLDEQMKSGQHSQRPESPPKSSPRKTRASTEREERRREEEAREAKEAKEAHKMEIQLEKARNKVKEEAWVYHQEQERVAAMQKQLAAKKEQEKQAKVSHVEIPRATRKSPRKTKAQLEAEGIAAAVASADELAHKDVEMSDESHETHAMPPPPRPKSQIGRPATKRPLRPAKEPLTKAKPPTVIRVDTGSQRGHQYHPSNSTLSATLQDSLASSQHSGPSQGLRHKASTSSIQSKASTNSFRSTATKALEAAARKKELDELAAQRKREAKQEIERQRAAIKEEERRKEEEQRRKEAERQREIQRERERVASIAEAKKAASRQAMEKRRLEMEKAKETRAPPPAIRPQPSGDLRHALEKDLPPVPPQVGDNKSKPPRMVNPSSQRQQEDTGRPATSAIHHTTKAPPKRPLQQDPEENHPRPTMQRNGPSYQQSEHHSKRRRTSQISDDGEDMTEEQPKMTAPPIRQSSVRQKEMVNKNLFPNGYSNAPPPGNLQRATLISQHNMNQAKPAHPMDMVQISKGPIPFALSSNHASQHMPARQGAPSGTGKAAPKSAAKSSPRYQNGENIDLPEIHTDSEDESSDDGKDFQAPAWTNSPDLRKQLAYQEGVDPVAVFGQPAALNMEEVFSKSKDRFHKFRARTSSANWSGQDKLTEDDIRKDIEARDRVRRQGGWTYDSMV